MVEQPRCTSSSSVTHAPQQQRPPPSSPPSPRSQHHHQHHHSSHPRSSRPHPPVVRSAANGIMSKPPPGPASSQSAPLPRPTNAPILTTDSVPSPNHHHHLLHHHHHHAPPPLPPPPPPPPHSHYPPYPGQYYDPCMTPYDPDYYAAAYSLAHHDYHSPFHMPSPSATPSPSSSYSPRYSSHHRVVPPPTYLTTLVHTPPPPSASPPSSARKTLPPPLSPHSRRIAKTSPRPNSAYRKSRFGDRTRAPSSSVPGSSKPASAQELVSPRAADMRSKRIRAGEPLRSGSTHTESDRGENHDRNKSLDATPGDKAKDENALDDKHKPVSPPDRKPNDSDKKAVTKQSKDAEKPNDSDKKAVTKQSKDAEKPNDSDKKAMTKQRQDDSDKKAVTKQRQDAGKPQCDIPSTNSREDRAEATQTESRDKPIPGSIGSHLDSNDFRKFYKNIVQKALDAVVRRALVRGRSVAMHEVIQYHEDRKLKLRVDVEKRKTDANVLQVRASSELQRENGSEVNVSEKGSAGQNATEQVDVQSTSMLDLNEYLKSSDHTKPNFSDPKRKSVPISSRGARYVQSDSDSGGESNADILQDGAVAIVGNSVNAEFTKKDGESDKYVRARKAEQNREKHSPDSVKCLVGTEPMDVDVPSEIESKSKGKSKHKSRNRSEPAADNGNRVDLDEIDRELRIDIDDDDDMDDVDGDVSHRDLRKKSSKSRRRHPTKSERHPTKSERKTKSKQKHTPVTDHELRIESAEDNKANDSAHGTNNVSVGDDDFKAPSTDKLTKSSRPSGERTHRGKDDGRKPLGFDHETSERVVEVAATLATRRTKRRSKPSAKVKASVDANAMADGKMSFALLEASDLDSDDEKLDEADADEKEAFTSNPKQDPFFDNINSNNRKQKSKQKQLTNLIGKPKAKSRSKQTKDQDQDAVNDGDDDEDTECPNAPQLRNTNVKGRSYELIACRLRIRRPPEPAGSRRPDQFSAMPSARALVSNEALTPDGMSADLVNQIVGSGSQENRNDNDGSNATTSPECEVSTESGGSDKVDKRSGASVSGSKRKSSALDTADTEVVQPKKPKRRRTTKRDRGEDSDVVILDTEPRVEIEEADEVRAQPKSGETTLKLYLKRPQNDVALEVKPPKDGVVDLTMDQAANATEATDTKSRSKSKGGKKRKSKSDKKTKKKPKRRLEDGANDAESAAAIVIEPANDGVSTQAATGDLVPSISGRDYVRDQIKVMTKTEKDEMHERDGMCARSMIYDRKAHKQKHTEEELMALVRPDNNLTLPLNGVAAVTADASARANRHQRRCFRKGMSQFNTKSEVLTVSELQQRRKRVYFRKSAIHGMGLYALEDVDANEFVIEYIGAVIRRSIADVREQVYEDEGLGDNYLFRIDSDFVIDATRRGGPARFINHSCDPNLIAKIISIGDHHHIVFYSKRRVQKYQELTYDYKFDIEGEDKKIPCLCCASNCRKYLN